MGRSVAASISWTWMSTSLVLPHAPLHDVAGPELHRDFRHRLRGVGVGEHRGRGDHREIAHQRQPSQELPVDAAGEVAVLLPGAEIGEGEDGDGGSLV